MRKKIKFRPLKFPAIGKYIDTPTKAEFPVVYFVDDIGDYKLTVGELSNIFLQSCRFQLKMSDIKRKKKFHRMLSPFFMGEGDQWKYEAPPHEATHSVPLLFGLLKIRKGKKKSFCVAANSRAIWFK
jgi:hypothetical protein